ncbi:hypothetical protein BLL40_09235 [Domibacillus mangrovi]|uniref:Uncharacterized protein n=1 Tax=Domibacillus mangrovi TaxID=1714354 RepID=A0A1Q5P3Z0_9BACI|nr:hypothetical protein BLL40_09235 [Domibacillus mangrovi]
MPFYPPNPGPRPYRPYPGQMSRRPGYYSPGLYPRQRQAGYNGQQSPSMWNNLNQVMTHVGHVSNGINMLRQAGSFISFFNNGR